MSNDEPSRRTVLRYGGVGTAAALAGCLWGDNDDESPNGDENGGEENGDEENGMENGEENGMDNGDENGMENGDEEPNYSEVFELAGDGGEQFKQWLVPNNPIGLQDGVTTVFGYQDFAAEDAQEVGWMATSRSELAQIYQTEPDAISGELFVGDPNTQRRRSIHLGSFDPDAIVETFEDAGTASQVDEYREYSVIEGEQGRGAVGSDAVLILPNYESYIDAKHADGERLIDTDEGVGHLLDVLPRGFQISVSRHENLDDLAVNGTTYHEVDDQGNPHRVTRAFVFHDDADATTDRAREIIEIGSSGYEEIITEEQHGRMVMIEFIQDWGSGTGGSE